MFSQIIYLINILSIFELINWFIYLFNYINILNPRFLYFKNKDTHKIIKRIDKLSNIEIEYLIKGSIVYDKINHKYVNSEDIDITKLTIKEITNVIGFTLFGIDIENITSSSKFILIQNLIKKIENILEIKFSVLEEDKYLYRRWGSNHIQFNFRPLIMQIPIRIAINVIHYYMIFKLKFKYNSYDKNKVAFLYNINDPNKKTILFIHGFGFAYIPYIKILLELHKHYNIIIIILPNISSYTYYDELYQKYFPSINDLNDNIYSFLEKNNVKDLLLLSHSFGTYITQILRKDPRSSVFSKIIMVDPIIFWSGCFKMILYAENPVYRKYPLYCNIFDNMINFLIYQCIYIKYVCHRVMYGPDFWIYSGTELEDTNIKLIFHKNDYVLNAELLYNKVKDNVKCYLFENEDATHGTILTDISYFDKLKDIIDS